MINQFLEEATEQSTTVTSSKSAGRRTSSTMHCNGYLKIGYQLWQKRSEEKVSILCESELTQSILVPSSNFKDTQEIMLMILHGNATEWKSIIRNGLIPGGTSLKRGRQAVFFTTVSPIENVYGMGETLCDLTKPRIMPYKNTWKRFQSTVFWCNWELAQREKACNFTKRGHMQSFSTTHCLQFA